MVGQIIESTQKHKLRSLYWAVRDYQPKYLFVKPLPIADWVVNYQSHQDACRMYNKALDTVAAHYNHTYTTNINIHPGDYDSFDLNGTGLSLAGFKVFWKALSECVNRLDMGRIKTIKVIERT